MTINAALYGLDGKKTGTITLPNVFDTPVRRDLIHRAYVNLDSHHYQPKGTHPTAGMDVVARSNDPPTGRGTSRIAKMRGGGGGRRGEAGGVASVRGGRQAHPPNVAKRTKKMINKKENRLALCSAIAATASREIVESRGHKTGNAESFPIIVSDDIEEISKARKLYDIIGSLGLLPDIERLRARKARSGRSSLRGRSKKRGKSILFVVAESRGNLERACGSIPGVEARSAANLSVLDLAPGSDAARLTVYSEKAIGEIAKLRSTHLEVMERTS